MEKTNEVQGEVVHEDSANARPDPCQGSGLHQEAALDALGVLDRRVSHQTTLDAGVIQEAVVAIVRSNLAVSEAIRELVREFKGAEITLAYAGDPFDPPTQDKD